MTLKKLELSGFKSFGRKETLFFDAPVVAIVGPNGSGKSNVAEAFRWVLGEQSLKSLRGKKGEDLIFNGSSSLPRLSRASVVVTFDNANRHFASIDFDEVAISREVFRDRTNKYKINGTIVRLRDIIELLAGISIGASGHHIIGQGEADRILNASPLERRLMIEEALGLKIYQWKLGESEKKLSKTEENIRQVESLRRELAPHLKFLKKQVEKIEKVRELKMELKSLYFDYLKREEIFLEREKERLTKLLISPEADLAKINEELKQKGEQPESSVEIIAEENRLREIEAELRILRTKKDDLGRSLGRLEGLLEAKEQVAEVSARQESVISLKDFRPWFADVSKSLEELLTLPDLGQVRERVQRLQSSLRTFIERYEGVATSNVPSADLSALRQEKESLLQELENLTQVEVAKQNQISDGKERIIKLRQEAQVAERDYYELKARRAELESSVQSLKANLEKINLASEEFKRELGEAGILVGREILNYQEHIIDIEAFLSEERDKQEDRRRQLERLKIRLEDMGVESTDVLKEYEEVGNRDIFLASELEDLAKSRESLQVVMADLRTKIETEFNAGIIKINKEFQKFFSVLFGGGSATLELLKPVLVKGGDVLAGLGEEGEDFSPVEEVEEGNRLGLEIAVNLPRKKIKGLAMLSGGERALTSIALLFAMSQVNPPPFLILDETDAALDEANSRKYGEMISDLSQHSQLILITHNRETMSHAGILYGVTMGNDSVSRIISIKFDEATQYAK